MSTTTEAPTPSVKKLYRCGLSSAAPIQTVHLAGHEFPKTTSKVTGYGQETEREKIQGTIHELTDEQVEKIKAKAKTRLVRQTHGKHYKAWLVDSDARYFVPEQSDLPVEKFIFMKEISTAENPFKPADLPTLAPAAPADLGDAAGANSSLVSDLQAEVVRLRELVEQQAAANTKATSSKKK